MHIATFLFPESDMLSAAQHVRNNGAIGELHAVTNCCRLEMILNVVHGNVASMQHRIFRQGKNMSRSAKFTLAISAALIAMSVIIVTTARTPKITMITNVNSTNNTKHAANNDNHDNNDDSRIIRIEADVNALSLIKNIDRTEANKK